MNLAVHVVFLFNVPPTAKVIWRRLKVSSDRLLKPGIEPATPGLQGKRFIHYTTAAPEFSSGFNKITEKKNELIAQNHIAMFSTRFYHIFTCIYTVFAPDNDRILK